MIDRGTFIQNLAVDFYKLSRDEVQEKLNSLEKWPSERLIDRIVPIEEAKRRLVSIPLISLVDIGFVVMVEKDKVLYPVRTIEIMMGINTDDMVEIAKNDIELARAIKGDRASIDDGLSW